MRVVVIFFSRLCFAQRPSTGQVTSMENYILIAPQGGGFVVVDINRYAHTCTDHTHTHTHLFEGTLSTEDEPLGTNAHI